MLYNSKVKEVLPQYTLEMCDICGKSYYYLYVSRTKLFGKCFKNILYTIRHCPYCNPFLLANML